MIKEADLEERVLAKHGFSFALKNLLTHFLLPPEFHLFFYYYRTDGVHSQVYCELGRIISSCPLRTIETLSLGFFTRPSAPLRTARSCLCLSAKRLLQRLTTVPYFA